MSAGVSIRDWLSHEGQPTRYDLRTIQQERLIDGLPTIQFRTKPDEDEAGDVGHERASVIYGTRLYEINSGRYAQTTTELAKFNKFLDSIKFRK